MVIWMLAGLTPHMKTAYKLICVATFLLLAFVFQALLLLVGD